MNPLIITGALDLDKPKKKLLNQKDRDYTIDTDSALPEENNGQPLSKQKAPLPTKINYKWMLPLPISNIQYPTDLCLINENREKSEVIIDRLYVVLSLKKKLRTYRRVARKRCLNIAKKKNKCKQEISREIREQLG